MEIRRPGSSRRHSHARSLLSPAHQAVCEMCRCTGSRADLDTRQPSGPTASVRCFRRATVSRHYWIDKRSSGPELVLESLSWSASFSKGLAKHCGIRVPPDYHKPVVIRVLRSKDDQNAVYLCVLRPRTQPIDVQISVLLYLGIPITAAIRHLEEIPILTSSRFGLGSSSVTPLYTFIQGERQTRIAMAFSPPQAGGADVHALLAGR